ncbi:triacylglycerol lipase [Amycolatopsis minnesotensis]|uniref:Triacylglycerol lipase n=1 Tax=Amycolatopsis minnesotensis TaxID=337894 RepID=A0ABN2RYF9_9PSEU
MHGFIENGTMWSALTQALLAEGYQDDQITAVTYNTITQSNVVTADQLGRTVQDLLRRTGASKVDIVSHSMGSLNSRYCVKFAGCAGRTDHWVSIAGANLGTQGASLCSFLITCREMLPGSTVLTKLNADPVLPAGTKWSTLWTPSDGVIIPATNTVLPGATNTEFDNLNHLNIFKDPSVIGKVKELLAS